MSDTARSVYIEQIATAVPERDSHQDYLNFVSSRLPRDEAQIFLRLARKSQIEHRYTVLSPPIAGTGDLDREGLYSAKGFAGTKHRMQIYEKYAADLSVKAIHKLSHLNPQSITHLVVGSCTGFYAPGLDFELQERLGLQSNVQRILIGFMGCFAGFNALRTASQIVKCDPQARVLVVCTELCSLHLQENLDLTDYLGAMQFADGVGAAIVSSQPSPLRLDSFYSEVVSSGKDLIQWRITDSGFRMHLDLKVPSILEALLKTRSKEWKCQDQNESEFLLWAIHPGGRSVLDAVKNALSLPDSALSDSRTVLKNFGNMSSASIFFVLQNLFLDVQKEGPGCALGFGPGLSIERFTFHKSAT